MVKRRRSTAFEALFCDAAYAPSEKFRGFKTLTVSIHASDGAIERADDRFAADCEVMVSWHCKS
jgi:hypothetical protein